MPRTKYWKKGQHKKVITAAPTGANVLINTGTDVPPIGAAIIEKAAQRSVQNVAQRCNETPRQMTHQMAANIEGRQVPIEEPPKILLLPNSAACIRGSFHQGDAKFLENKGKQCVANSCASILFDKIKNASSSLG